MGESNQNSGSDQQMDQLLRRSFRPNQALSDDFEDQVMSSIRSQELGSRKQRTILITMMIYWAAASMTAAWLWFEKVSPGLGANGNTWILLPMLGLMGLGVFLVMRQSSFRISDVFLGTIR